jgi:ABC-type nitrate/sulfonate/bicarbonate transport system permease component
MGTITGDRVSAAPEGTGLEGAPRQRVFTEPGTLKLIALVILVVIWQVVGMTAGTFFATPASTVSALIQLIAHGGLLSAAWASIEVFLLGFVVSAVIGVAIGIAAGLSKPISRLIDLPVTIFWATPTVALIPLFVLWLGLTTATSLAIVFLSTLFPVIINTTVGVETIDPLLFNVAAAFNKSRAYRLFKIVIPAAAPHIGSGLRLGVGRAIIGVFVAEVFTSATGIGEQMQTYATYFQTANYLAALIVFIIISMCATGLVTWGTRRWAKWDAA